MRLIVDLLKVVALAIALAACVETRDGNPWPANIVAPSDFATRPTLRGLDRFDVVIRPVTGLCGMFEYKVDHAEPARARIEKAARERLGAASSSAVVDIRSIDLQLRCLSKGFGGWGSECQTDATIVLSTTWASGQRNRTVEGRGETTASARAGLACETPGRSVALAMDGALEKALAVVFATAP